MKKMDVFDAIEKIRKALTPLIILSSITLEFRSKNSLSKDARLLILYIYKGKESNFSVHQFNIDNVQLDLLISEAKAKIAEITRKQPISITLIT